MIKQNQHKMKSISKKSIKKFGNFFREVAVVVLGVAITLSASVWISNRNEKRDMALYLNAIKMELEENISIINESIEYLQPDAKYSAYLRTHDKKSLNADSIEYYASTCCYIINSFKFKTNAFEAFKISGIIRLLDDKELLLTIWDVYTGLDSQNESLKWYSDIKWGYMEKEIIFVEKGALSSEKLTNGIPMYHFYITGLSRDVLKDCKNILNDTKKTVSELEKRK